MTRAKTWAWKIVRILAICYALLCVLLLGLQRKLLYFPATDVVSNPGDYGMHYTDVSIPVGTGAHLSGWLIPGPSSTAPTLLYFHGNGANIGANAEQAARLARACCNVLLFDYRGYGTSSGPFPNESRIYEDAEAAWRYLVKDKNVAANRIVLFGHSLGGGVAVEMATRHPESAALLVESSFTSIADRAALDPLYRLFPVHLLTYQRFESARKIAQVHMPTLVITGTADTIVPTQMTQELYARAAGPKQLLVVNGAGHENCGSVGGAEYVQTVSQFVSSSTPSGKQISSH